jgi:hypothetical protein
MLVIFSDVETLDNRCTDRAQLIHDDRVPLLPARREPGPRRSLNVSDLTGARHRPSPVDASTEYEKVRLAGAHNARSATPTWLYPSMVEATQTTVISSGQRDRLVFHGFVRRRHVAAVTADARSGVILAWLFGTALGS